MHLVLQGYHWYLLSLRRLLLTLGMWWGEMAYRCSMRWSFVCVLAGCTDASLHPDNITFVCVLAGWDQLGLVQGRMIGIQVNENSTWCRPGPEALFIYGESSCAGRVDGGGYGVGETWPQPMDVELVASQLQDSWEWGHGNEGCWSSDGVVAWSCHDLLTAFNLLFCGCRCRGLIEVTHKPTPPDYSQLLLLFRSFKLVLFGKKYKEKLREATNMGGDDKTKG